MRQLTPDQQAALESYRQGMREGGPQIKGILRVQTRKVPEMGMQTEVTAGGHTFLSDEPAERGGTDEYPSALEYFLAGVAMCETQIASSTATRMGMEFESVEVLTRATYDRRSFVNAPVPANLLEVRSEFRFKTDAPAELVREVVEETERRCPAVNTVKTAVPYVSKIVLNGEVLVDHTRGRPEMEGTR